MAKAENCYNCVYSHWDRNQAMWTMSVGVPSRPTCGNQPDYPGRMRTCPLGPVCRNFRARPPTPTGETVKTIPLGDGFYAYVDAADYEWLNQWNWSLHSGYAARKERGKTIYLHREIMQPPRGMVVDHRNHNRVDDTRANLKICTQGENLRNTEKRRRTASRFRGVYFCKRTQKWCPRVKFAGRRLYLGLFAEETAAARAHDRAAVEYLGPSACLNFPEEWPSQRRQKVYAHPDAAQKRESARERAKRKKPKPAGRPRATGHKPRATPRKGKKPRRSKPKTARAARPRLAGDKAKRRGRKASGKAKTATRRKRA